MGLRKHNCDSLYSIAERDEFQVYDSDASISAERIWFLNE